MFVVYLHSHQNVSAITTRDLSKVVDTSGTGRTFPASKHSVSDAVARLAQSVEHQTFKAGIVSEVI